MTGFLQESSYSPRNNIGVQHNSLLEKAVSGFFVVIDSSKRIYQVVRDAIKTFIEEDNKFAQQQQYKNLGKGSTRRPNHFSR